MAGGLFATMRAQGKALADGLDAGNALPNHYQDRLPEFLRRIRVEIIVETGAATGISTDRILQALDEKSAGVLHSIDPAPTAGLFEIDHLRWIPHRALSVDAMPTIFAASGPWDVFLHDSDHGVWCQTFEYELAWQFVRGGGYLLSDDRTWGSPPHDAWRLFCMRHHLTPFELGACGVVQKPAFALASGYTGIAGAVQHARELADRATDLYHARIP